MVTFLKGRRRNDDTVVAVDESGANITATLEALVARAEAAAEQLRAAGARSWSGRPSWTRCASAASPSSARWRGSRRWAPGSPRRSGRPSG